MIVILRPDAPPEVTDVDRFDRLHAESGTPLDQVTLAPLADADADADDHVWLDVAQLRAAGERLASDATFGELYDAMIDFAAKHGWLDESGTRVRAHVVPPAP